MNALEMHDEDAVEHAVDLSLDTPGEIGDYLRERPRLVLAMLDLFEKAADARAAG